MKLFKLTCVAALIAVSGVAMAADPASDAARQQRMDDALQTYRGGADRNPAPGPFARAEASTKRGLKKAGAAVERGAKKVGHAVGTGAEKTGDAIRRTGEKMQDSTAPSK